MNKQTAKPATPLPHTTSAKSKSLTLTLTLLLPILLVAGLQLATPVKANMMYEKNSPIYIRSDGTVDPTNSLLKRDGNNYTFTGSSIPSFQTMGLGGYHVHTIVVQCSNIILDGADVEI